jgi:hypothetical protein
MSRSGRGGVGRGSRDRSGPRKSRSGSWKSDRARGGADWTEFEFVCFFFFFFWRCRANRALRSEQIAAISDQAWRS